MAVVIRLQRAGARNRPFYRVVVADSRKARDGAFIEKVGYYDPLPDPDVISLDRERIASWLGKGTRPSEAVRQLIRRYDRRAAAGETVAAAEPAPPEAEAAAATSAAAAQEPPAPSEK